MFEFIAVGHLSRDLLVTRDTRREVLGGGTAYAMLAPSLGVHPSGIVSVVGEDFEESYVRALEGSGLDLSALVRSGPHSTRFVNEYDSLGRRTQRIESVAPTIGINDIPESHARARIVHFCPLTLHEIDSACYRHVRPFPEIVSLDVQGYTRAVSGDRIVTQPWQDPAGVLRYIDVVKADSTELLVATGAKSENEAVNFLFESGVRIAIVTRDRRGSTIHTPGECVNIPLVLADRVVDTTGSGDTYVIGFLVEYTKSNDLWRAGLFGATCASLNLEHIGPYIMPTLEKVEERMRRYL